MKKLFILIVLMVGLCNADAQQLEFINSRKINLNSQKLSKKDIYEIMKDSPEALQMYKSGKKLRTIGDITFLGGLGIAVAGVLIDIYGEVGDHSTEVSYHDDYTLSIVSLSIGGTMMAATIPLKIAGKKKIRKSVELYNENTALSLKNQKGINLSIINNNKGIGIRLAL